MITKWETSLQDGLEHRIASAPHACALVLDRGARARFSTCLRSFDVGIQYVERVGELRIHIGHDAALAMVIAETTDVDGMPSTPVLSEVRAARPMIPLIAYCKPSAADAEMLRVLAFSGADNVIFQGVTDEGVHLSAGITAAVQACGAKWIESRIRDRIPHSLQSLVTLVLNYPSVATSVTAAAQALGIHRRSLVNRCYHAGFPVPGALIAWCRLLVAAHLMRAQGGSVEAIAYQLEFPSATSLRNMLRRYTNMRPQEIRAPDGFERLLAKFDEAILDDQRAIATM